MSDAAAALWVSIAALAVAGLSAWYARGSVIEARRTRKLSQSENLSSHFDNIAKLRRFVEEGGYVSEDDVTAGQESINFLKYSLSKDSDLQGFLNQLQKWVSDVLKDDPYLFVGRDDGISQDFVSIGGEYKTPQGIDEAFEIFEKKKHEYLTLEK